MGNLNLQGVCEKLPPTAHILIWLAVLGWEYGLGKTSFGSSLELFVETPIKKVLAWLHISNGPQ